MEGNFYDQMQAVRASGLLNHSDFLFTNAVGDRSEWDQQGLPSDKIFLTFHGALDDYEAPTLEYLQRYCNGFPQLPVYYFHCKGVTHPESPRKERIVHWHMLMEQLILWKWRDCAEALMSGNVACGVNLKGLNNDDVSWRFFRATSGGRDASTLTGCRRRSTSAHCISNSMQE